MNTRTNELSEGATDAAELDWREAFAGKPFISDLGFTPKELVMMEDGQKQTLGRFAAWLPIPGQARHQIVEVGAELKPLMAKYGIPEGQILKVGSGGKTRS